MPISSLEVGSGSENGARNGPKGKGRRKGEEQGGMEWNQLKGKGEDREKGRMQGYCSSILIEEPSFSAKC